tara:strand:- start:2796 stop:4445 length:1650 start_codon:yes stop_codon:yes gene_type:complete
MSRPRLSLSALISLLVAVMIVLSLGLALWLFVGQQRSALEQAQATRVTDLAQVVAGRSDVGSALASQRDNATLTPGPLQASIERLRRELDVDFIVVMTETSQRLTHPDPSRVGRFFQGGDEGPALEGERYASRSKGTLGISIRGFAPVLGDDGEVIGAVAVGVTMSSLLPTLEAHRHQIVLGVLALMLAAALGAGLLARYIKRVLLGLEPYQIAQLVEERQAMLSSVHEGILAVDVEGRITLVNQAARRLLQRAGLPELQPGIPLADYLPETGMLEVLAEDRASLDQQVAINDQVLLANRVPIHHRGQVIGAVATLRDKTDVHRLAEELTGVRRYAEALRATTHDFKNRLHVITGLAALGDLVALKRYLRELNDGQLVVSDGLNEAIRDPVLAGFLLGKRSEARERDITLTLSAEQPLPAAADPEMGHTLVTVIGNLLENAFEALASCEERRVSLTLDYQHDWLTLEIQDTGPGIPPALQARVFERGLSTKGQRRGLGLGLARERVEAHQGVLSLYSSEGQGTLIEVALPYAAATDDPSSRDLPRQEAP